MFDDFDFPVKSTDDFHTYNGTGEELSQGEIDGYDDNSFDPIDFVLSVLNDE